jgi:hypothetical protein
MALVGRAQAFSGHNPFKAHLLHEANNALAIDFKACLSQARRHSTAAVKREPGVPLIEFLYDSKRAWLFSTRLVVVAHFGKTYELKLTIYAYTALLRVNQGPFL